MKSIREEARTKLEAGLIWALPAMMGKTAVNEAETILFRAVNRGMKKLVERDMNEIMGAMPQNE